VSRTPEQREKFLEALYEGLPLWRAMLAAGYSLKVARQGRAKLCSSLLLDVEDHKRDVRAWEHRVHELWVSGLVMDMMGTRRPKELVEMWPHIEAWKAWLDRREQRRRKYARRHPLLLILPRPAPGAVVTGEVPMSVNRDSAPRQWEEEHGGIRWYFAERNKDGKRVLTYSNCPRPVSC